MSHDIISLRLAAKNTKQYDLQKDIATIKRVITNAIRRKDCAHLHELYAAFSSYPTHPEALRLKRELEVRSTDKPEADVKVKKEEGVDTKSRHDQLIVNEALFPRGEYYARLKGTTFFKMDKPKHYETYHRSEKTRTAKLAPEPARRYTPNVSTPLEKRKENPFCFYAHMGAYKNPFELAPYQAMLHQTEKTVGVATNIHDLLLHYRRAMAEVAVNRFNEKFKEAGFLTNAPIVYVQNNYPCIMVSFSTFAEILKKGHPLTSGLTSTPAFQRYFICIFVAILNAEAIKQNWPIEMVVRSSFNHNIPSVCETEETFRISLGLVPKAYAELIGDTLVSLCRLLKEIVEKKYPVVQISEKLHSAAFEYNKKKKGSLDFHDKNLWGLLNSPGDSTGKKVMTQCFRNKGVEDWLINRLMDLLKHEKPLEAIEKASLEMISKLDISITPKSATVSMNRSEIEKELSAKRGEIVVGSFEPLYQSDPNFLSIITSLANAVEIEVPKMNLYAELERAVINYLVSHKASEAKEASLGSDSECEMYLSDDDAAEKLIVHHAKLRLRNGMACIVAAHHAAAFILSAADKKQLLVDHKSMYYEVGSAIPYVNVFGLTKGTNTSKKAGDLSSSGEADKIGSVLYYDLNHCVSSGYDPADRSLEVELNDKKPDIVVLDITSATEEETMRAVKDCFKMKAINYVFVLESGLKNNQGGADFNPYGELHIIARNKNDCQHVFQNLSSKLKNEMMPHSVHEMVRVCKLRGFALKFSKFACAKKEEVAPLKGIGFDIRG